MAHAPRNQVSTHREPDAQLPGLRDMPALPLRVGRHLATWLVWHTARVSLLADAPPPGRRNS